MYEKIIKYLVVGSIVTFGGVVIKKLNDIQAEIEYFESAKNIVWNRKEYNKISKRS